MCQGGDHVLRGGGHVFSKALELEVEIQQKKW